MVFFLVGFILGYSIGNQRGLSWCVDTGLHFLEVKGIDIDVNRNLLATGVFMYQNQISSWLNNNAPIRNDTRY